MRKIENIVEPERLLLSWQDPASRLRYTVGIVSKEAGGVCFRYLQGSELEKARACGFRGYPAFHNFGSEYRLGVMESFMTRLPPRSREDFGKFLEYWHIDAKADISNFALLGYTGAVLPRDGFRFLPVFPKIGCLEFVVEVAGYRYHDRTCDIGGIVHFSLEPDNEFDPMAVAVTTCDGEEKIGYIMHGMGSQFAEWLAFGRLQGEIIRINGTSGRPIILVCVVFERQGKISKVM